MSGLGGFESDGLLVGGEGFFGLVGFDVGVVERGEELWVFG